MFKKKSNIQIKVIDYHRVHKSLEDFWINNALISNNKITHNPDYDSYLAKHEHNGKYFFKKSELYAIGIK